MNASRTIVALLAVATIATVTTAHGEPTEWWLNLGGVSAHTRDGYNGLNPGLGLTARISPDWAVGAGFYRNSQRAISRYIAATYTPLEVAGLRIGLVGGAVNGYEVNNGHAIPVISPLVEWRADRVAVGVSFVPQVAHLTDTAVLALQVSVRF